MRRSPAVIGESQIRIGVIHILNMGDVAFFVAFNPFPVDDAFFRNVVFVQPEQPQRICAPRPARDPRRRTQRTAQRLPQGKASPARSVLDLREYPLLDAGSHFVVFAQRNAFVKAFSRQISKNHLHSRSPFPKDTLSVFPAPAGALTARWRHSAP